MPWREAQDAGLLWAPLRKPHENALDEHWLTRKHLRRCRASRARPQLPLSDQQMAQQPRRAGRSAAARRCSARTPQAVLGEANAPPERAGAAAPGREPAALGAAQQAVPAARHQDPRFRVVSRLGRRHAVSRGDGRGELQGRVEGQSRHAAGGDGAGRRPRRARRGDRPAARRAAIPTWAASSTTRMPASAASRSTSATPRACRSPRTWCASAMSSPRGSRPACCSAWGSATTC